MRHAGFGAFVAWSHGVRRCRDAVVIGDEIARETHHKGPARWATSGLILGAVVMLTRDAARQ